MSYMLCGTTNANVIIHGSTQRVNNTTDIKSTFPSKYIYSAATPICEGYTLPVTCSVGEFARVASQPSGTCPGWSVYEYSPPIRIQAREMAEAGRSPTFGRWNN